MFRYVAALLMVPCMLQAQTPTVAPANSRPTTLVAPAGEPGTPVIISGFVFGPDGRTPLPNASVYVYQTDARGYYAPNDARASDAPRPPRRASPPLPGARPAAT